MAQQRRVKLGKDGKPAPIREDDLPMSRQEAADLPGEAESCNCPRLEAEDWHEIESDWSDAAFLRGHMWAFMGVPIGYGAARRKLFSRAQKTGSPAPDDAMVIIGSGRMRRPILLEVEDAPGSATRPGGIAFSRLVPAPMGRMKKMVGETVDIATKRYRRKPDAIWIWYLTCAVCSAPREFETLIIAHYRDKK
ncbi:MAG: hydrolase [Dehalococcoidia bacterium]